MGKERKSEENKVPSLEEMQIHTKFIRPKKKSAAPESSSSSSTSEEPVLDIEAGEVNVHEYFKLQINLHKHEDILREEVIDDSTLPKRERLKKEFINHVRIFLAVFSQKFFFRHRSLLTTTVEVLFSPIMVFLILSAFTHGISWDKAIHEKRIAADSAIRFKDIDEERLKTEFRNKYCDSGGRIFLLYYPDTTLVRRVLKEMIDEFDIEMHNHFYNTTERTCEKRTGCGENTGLIACSSEQELLELAMLHRKDRKKHREPVGLIFDYEGWEKDKDDLPIIPKKLDYTIRVFNEEIENTFIDFPRVKPPRSENEVSPYVSSGFLGLQYAVDEAYLEIVDDAIRHEIFEAGGGSTAGAAVAPSAKTTLLGDEVMPMLKDPDFLFASKEDTKAWPIRTFKMYYYPNFFGLTLRNLVVIVVTTTLIASYGFFTYSIVKQIVTENLSGIKDLLQIHNLPMILHWVTLLLNALALRFITALLITTLLFYDYGNGAIIVKSNPVVIFFFMYNHMLALTGFNYFLSVVSENALLSGLSAIGISFATYLAPFVLEKIGLVTFWTNLLLCSLFPNWALLNGIRQIVWLESDDKGLDFSTTWRRYPGQFLSFFAVSTMLFFTGVFYLMGAVFKDMTKQKTLSKSYKWYEFKKKRKEKELQQRDHEEMLADKEAHREDFIRHRPDIYEEPKVPDDGKHHHHYKVMVRVRDVCAYSGRHKAVLSHVGFNIYHGEITIILGHSGAGKSTLIHVMAGMRVPSHGYVTVHGYDVNYEKRQAHKYLGYCPQKNILFNLFTVQEHITFCYRLRGLGIGDAQKHCIALLHLLRLSESAHKYPNDLSKKDKRKLSISLALVNAPKVMLLDEPTHGLDCLARREIWSILVELKHHHTIVIATNRMDEAEYLGDRIALLSHGQLVCFGTPNYLKDKYDTGYYLKLYPAENATLDVEKCFEIVENHINEKAHVNKGGEDILEEDDVIIELPKTKLHRFPKMLDDLEKKKETLGLGHYTVAQIALDDIFNKICEAIALENEPPDKSFRRACGDTRKKTFEGIDLPKALKHETFTPTKRNSAMALIHKRIAILRAKNDFFVWEYVFPLLVIGIVCSQNITFIEPIPESPSREMSLRTYDQARVFYRLGATDIPKKLNRDYKEKLADGLKSAGIPLLKTEQVLIKLEDLNAWKDGVLREKHIVAMEFRQYEKYETVGYRTQKAKQKYLQFVGYHSSGALHSPPIVMNLITNVMLTSMLPKSKSDYQVAVSSHPLPTKLVSNFVRHCASSCVLFAVLASFGLSFFVAGTIVVPIIERKTGMKHLQLMTGLHPVIHWGTEYLFDFVISFIMGIVIVAIFGAAALAAGKPTWHWGLLAIGVIMFLYLCWSSIPFVFFISTLLPSKISGYGTYLLLHAMLGVIPIMMMEIKSIETARPSSTVILFRNLLHVFPMYTITSGLHRWFEVDARCSLCLTVPTKVQQMCKLTPSHGDHATKEREQLYKFILKEDTEFAQCCERVCRSSSVGGDKCFKPPHFFDWQSESFETPMLWYHFFALILQGLFYWGLLIFIERGFVANMVHTAVIRFIRAQGKEAERPRPPDVKMERRRCEELLALESLPDEIALVCLDLTKSYATVMVVNDVSVAIKKGECIGILGGGASGKTTLVKLLCGEVLATTGEVYIGDSSIHHHRVKFLRQIGYCPQNFCLFELFTPKQMLELMGRLRGIPAHELSGHVNQWLEVFGLIEVREDQCKDLTVGMRRCVCAAMAVIGGCEIILMDEPTSGTDPPSRQKFWAIVKLLTSYGRTVIFTTYNVEECVFLSSRMLVICEGNVQALGPPRELVKRFARGFTILIRVRHDVLTPLEIMSTTMGRVAKLKKAMKQKFKHLTLRDEQDNLLLYFLRDLRITWGDLFRKMEEIGDEFGEILEKYYISEATLDEIFVMLTNKYREMDAPRKMEPRMAGTVTQKEAEKKALRNELKKKK